MELKNRKTKCLKDKSPNGTNPKQALKFLIDKRADATLKDSNGRSFLRYATKCGMVEVVKALIDEEATDVNMKDSNGQSPLHSAATYGGVEVVKVKEVGLSILGQNSRENYIDELKKKKPYHKNVRSFTGKFP